MATIDDLAMPVLLLGAFRGLVDAVHEQLAQQGFPDVRAQHGFALQAIGEGCTSVQLGTRLGVSKQAATKTALGLEQRGLIERTRNEADRRERILVITDKGHRMLELSAQVFRTEIARWRTEVGDDRVDTTLRTLSSVGHGKRAWTDLSDWS
jgi:DNA-binding MarR family transcriptional regulator